MPLTVYTATPVKQAGRVKIALAPKFSNLAAPSLAALTIDATCSISQFGSTTDVQMTERQDLCDLDAYEWVDKRIRSLDQMTFRADPVNQTAILALLAEDAEVGILVRPYTLSTAALAATDKVWTFNARVGKLDPNPLAVGNEYEWIVDWYSVTRNLNAVLAA